MDAAADDMEPNRPAEPTCDLGPLTIGEISNIRTALSLILDRMPIHVTMSDEDRAETRKLLDRVKRVEEPLLRG